MKKTIKKSSKLMEELSEKVSKKQKKSTTIKDVLTMVEKWAESNDVSFIGSFVSFDDKHNVDEAEVIAFGYKNEMKLHLETLSEMAEEEGDENGFINL